MAYKNIKPFTMYVYKNVKCKNVTRFKVQNLYTVREQMDYGFYLRLVIIEKEEKISRQDQKIIFKNCKFKNQKVKYSRISKSKKNQNAKTQKYKISKK